MKGRKLLNIVKNIQIFWKWIENNKKIMSYLLKIFNEKKHYINHINFWNPFTQLFQKNSL